MKERTLRIAKSKVKLFHGKTRSYCGCLTPSEFLALVEIGVVAKEYDISNAKLWKKRGESNPSWYYFRLGKVMLDQ